jgi:hypothetical protein
MTSLVGKIAVPAPRVRTARFVRSVGTFAVLVADCARMARAYESATSDRRRQQIADQFVAAHLAA